MAANSFRLSPERFITKRLRAGGSRFKARRTALRTARLVPPRTVASVVRTPANFSTFAAAGRRKRSY